MSTPVFVIHGIGNRDEADFGRTAVALARAAGDGLVAHPIFWGDLGAHYKRIADTVPRWREPTETRGEDTEPDEDDHREGLARFLLGDRAAAEIRDDDVPEPVLDAATVALATGGGEEIRDGEEDPADAAAVRAAITEYWPDTQWLPLVDDEELQRAVGAAVAGPLAEDTATLDTGEELRDGAELRGLDVGGFVRRRLDELDRVVGAAFGAAGGRLNTTLRTTLLPGITRGVGDILVYQRHRTEIQERVRSVISQVDPELGRSPERPVDVLAHSLGGVIVVDLATGDEPLWIRRLVTFGSQSPFFHGCDPRGGVLTPYAGTPVPLPASIGAWTNLWEPFDPVAFVAAKVFRFADGSTPTDIEVPHLASSGLWTHTDYWKLRFVAEAIGAALGLPARPPGTRGMTDGRAS